MGYIHMYMPATPSTVSSCVSRARIKSSINNTLVTRRYKLVTGMCSEQICSIRLNAPGNRRTLQECNSCHYAISSRNIGNWPMHVSSMSACDRDNVAPLGVGVRTLRSAALTTNRMYSLSNFLTRLQCCWAATNAQ
jgi:hypothetical protein